MHRVTCPHCASALHVPESVTDPVVTCPRCLSRIPNPGAPSTGAPATEQRVPANDAGVEGGTRSFSLPRYPSGSPPDADAEAGGDTRGLGWGLVLLAGLLVVGIVFFASLAVAGSGFGPILIWAGVGGIGSFVVGILAALAVGRGAGREVWPGAAVAAAVLVGVLAGVVLLCLTCGAVIVGGGTRGP
jgi:hypothetical protein